MCEYHIHLAVFQETELNPKNRIPSLGPDYTLFRKDRPREGDLLTAIDNSLLYDEHEIVVDGTLEAQSVYVKANHKNLHITNFYIPPHSSCPKDYKITILTLLSEEDSNVLSDANANSPLWCQRTDAKLTWCRNHSIIYSTK